MTENELLDLIAGAVARDRRDETWGEVLAVTSLPAELGEASPVLEAVLDSAAARLDRPRHRMARWVGERALRELARREPQHFSAHRDARSFLLACDGNRGAALRERIPELAATRVEADREDRRRILVHYDPSHRLCSLVEGLLLGIGVHYGEGLVVEQTRCAERGDESCVILCRFDVLA